MKTKRKEIQERLNTVLKESPEIVNLDIDLELLEETVDYMVLNNELTEQEALDDIFSTIIKYDGDIFNYDLDDGVF